MKILRPPSSKFIISLTAGLLFLPTLIAGKTLYWGVPGLQIVPWRLFAWQQIKSGMLPFWNPMNGMGAPLLANYQLALFYPPALISFVFAGLGGAEWLAWSLTLLAVLHLIWGGYGMTLLVKELGLGRQAQIICGLSFALCAFFTTRVGVYNMIWVGTWFPFLLLFTLRLSKSDQNLYKALFGLVIAGTCMLLAGHAQLTYYCFQFAFIWFVVRVLSNVSWRFRIQKIVQFVGAIFFSCLLAAIQLIPTAEYLMQSQRSSAVDFSTSMSFSFWPWRIISLFAPDFFGNPAANNYWGYGAFWEDAGYFGLLSILFAYWGLGRLLFRSLKDDPTVIDRWTLTFIGIAGFIFALGRNTFIFPFFYRYVPTFDMFNGPSRYIFWTTTTLILLSAFEIDRFCHPGKINQRRISYFAVISLAIFIGALAGYFLLGKDLPTIFLATARMGFLGFLIFLVLRMRPVQADRFLFWEYTLTALVVVDLLVANWGSFPVTSINYFSESKPVGPILVDDEPKRLHINLSDEYDLKFHRFLRFQGYPPIENVRNARAIPLPNLNMLDDNKYLTTNFDPMVPGGYYQWMSYIDRLPESLQKTWLVWSNVDEILKIAPNSLTGVAYEKVEFSNRFWWYPCAFYELSNTKSLSIIDSTVRKSGEIPLVIHDDSDITDCDSNRPTPLIYSRLSETPTEIEILYEAKDSGWIVMADTYYPGWHASIDGVAVGIQQANVAFRAIPTLKGNHTLRVVYEPTTFLISAFISGLAVLTLLILWLARRNFENADKIKYSRSKL